MAAERREDVSYPSETRGQNKIGNDGDRRKLSTRFLIKMQIRRATSLIFFRSRLDFLLSVSAVPALLLFASIDLSFLQLCCDTGLDRSRVLFKLFILLSLSISSCLRLIFTSLHPVRAWTRVARSSISSSSRAHFEDGEFLSSKNVLFLCN